MARLDDDSGDYDRAEQRKDDGEEQAQRAQSELGTIGRATDALFDELDHREGTSTRARLSTV